MGSNLWTHSSLSLFITCTHELSNLRLVNCIHCSLFINKDAFVTSVRLVNFSFCQIVSVILLWIQILRLAKILDYNLEMGTIQTRIDYTDSCFFPPRGLSKIIHLRWRWFYAQIFNHLSRLVGFSISFSIYSLARVVGLPLNLFVPFDGNCNVISES